jgi:hypothetical protein
MRCRDERERERRDGEMRGRERERGKVGGKVGLPAWPVGKDHCPSDILDFVE